MVGYPVQFTDREGKYISISHGHDLTKNLKAKGGEARLDRISASVNFGSYCGPAFNSAGQLVGMVVAMHTRHPNYYYLARAPDVQRFLEGK